MYGYHLGNDFHRITSVAFFVFPSSMAKRAGHGNLIPFADRVEFGGLVEGHDLEPRGVLVSASVNRQAKFPNGHAAGGGVNFHVLPGATGQMNKVIPSHCNYS
jgi:hypothetical protein